jgi:cell division FtsZ-interacting protein ZapD
MPSSDLTKEYERLRRELEAAYAAPVWNSVQIDRIANAISRIERSLMRLSAIGESLISAKSSHTRQFDMSQA